MNELQINRGIVQNLMTNAASFASNVVNFCEELEEFWAFAYLLKGMSQRLEHCCCRELLPLMELPAVKQVNLLIKAIISNVNIFYIEMNFRVVQDNFTMLDLSLYKALLKQMQMN